MVCKQWWDASAISALTGCCTPPHLHPVEANDGRQTSGAQLEVLALSLGLVVGVVLGWCLALVKLQNPKLAASIPLRLPCEWGETQEASVLHSCSSGDPGRKC